VNCPEGEAMITNDTKDLKLSMTTERVGEVFLFNLTGNIETGNVAEAKDLLSEAWNQEKPQILFDLSKVEYVDSAGLGFLIGTLRRAAQSGGSLKLCGLSAYLTGIFAIVNLQNILEIFPTREQALESYQ
jgi:anti-sigma B factor antagonist